MSTDVASAAVMRRGQTDDGQKTRSTPPAGASLEQTMQTAWQCYGLQSYACN